MKNTAGGGRGGNSAGGRRGGNSAVRVGGGARGVGQRLASAVEEIQCTGGIKFDIRAFMEELPTFSQLPQKAPEINHRQDGKSGIDSALKAAQQSQLHSLRMQAHIYDGRCRC